MTKENVIVSNNIGTGYINDELSELNTYIPENVLSSYWFSWNIFKKGNMTFDIEPLYQMDIDFILFKSENNEKPCKGKRVMRLMLSGTSNLNKYKKCGGKTGLNETSIDTAEYSGCDFGDDNYLSQINALENETYYLVIINFHEYYQSFKISFCGSALLSHTDSICKNVEGLENPVKNAQKQLSVKDTLTQKNDTKQYNAPRIYPNPCGGKLKIDFAEEMRDNDGFTEVFNNKGELLLIIRHGAKDCDLDLRYRFGTGVFTLKIHLQNRIFTKKLFIVF